MNGRQRGFLLLTSHLGDPRRKVLTVAQFRQLASRVAAMEKPEEDRSLTVSDIMALDYTQEMAERIVSLLSDEEQLSSYLGQGEKMDCRCITRLSENYPARLRRRLGADCPGSLWIKGDPVLLERPAIALVGSRELRDENLAFAAAVGKMAARQGFVLVSGNARGADRTAQEACLEAGGQVISVVADCLQKCPLTRNVLYLSEDGFNSNFSTHRALSRNHIIHCLADRVFVAQATLGKGGTWDGTAKNLRYGWSCVYCFDDGTSAAQELIQMGAEAVSAQQLIQMESLLWGV